MKKGSGSSGGSSGGGFGDLFNMTKTQFKVYGVDNRKIDVKFKDVAGL